MHSGSVARPHTHDLYHIVLYTGGDNAFLLGNQQVPCRDTTLVLAPPGVPHDFGPTRPGSVSYQEVTFELSNGTHRLNEPFDEVLSEYAGLTIPPVAMVTQAPVQLARAITHLIESCVRHATSSAPMGLFAAYQSVGELLGVIAEETMEVSRDRTDTIAEARRHLLRRFAEPASVVELAAELGITQSHLSRAFKARYGVSPMQFRQDLRIAAAVRLLSMGSLSCKEVAARLGFADVQTFTKAFTRHRGQTPGRLARELARSPLSSMRDA